MAPTYIQMYKSIIKRLAWIMKLFKYNDLFLFIFPITTLYHHFKDVIFNLKHSHCRNICNC